MVAGSNPFLHYQPLGEQEQVFVVHSHHVTRVVEVSAQNLLCPLAAVRVQVVLAADGSNVEVIGLAYDVLRTRNLLSELYELVEHRQKSLLDIV